MTWSEVETSLAAIRQALFDQIALLPSKWEEHVRRNPDMARIYSPLTRACWWNDQMCDLAESVLQDDGFTISHPGGHVRAARGSLVIRFKKLYGRAGRSSSKTINRTFLEPTIDGIPLQTVVVIGYVADQFSRQIKDILVTVPLADHVLHAESLQLSLFQEAAATSHTDMQTQARIKVSKPRIKQQEEAG